MIAMQWEGHKDSCNIDPDIHSYSDEMNSSPEIYGDARTAHGDFQCDIYTTEELRSSSLVFDRSRRTGGTRSRALQLPTLSPDHSEVYLQFPSCVLVKSLHYDGKVASSIISGLLVSLDCRFLKMTTLRTLTLLVEVLMIPRFLYTSHLSDHQRKFLYHSEAPLWQMTQVFPHPLAPQRWKVMLANSGLVTGSSR